MFRRLKGFDVSYTGSWWDLFGTTLHIIGIWFGLSSYLTDVLGMSCGLDNSRATHVYEGQARIETYPWLGILYYPYNKKRFTTAVVLVTRQIVLGAATEIDKLPKADFRARARVVLGHNCSGPYVGVRDYSYHPDYNRETFSALAIVQLETDHVKFELRPICPPPTHFSNHHFYAMVLADNCRKSTVRIHKMRYVSPGHCKEYYRRTDLGFGVYGPGCQAPARFLDYGMYHAWVRRSVDRIGRPAITTLGPNHVVLRRTLSNVQRFGPCDKEETKQELFTDHTQVVHESGTMKYNMSIYADTEYSCVVFKADYTNEVVSDMPQIRLRRWCAGSTGVCFGFQFLEIHFYVEITFKMTLKFHVMAYGKEAKMIDPLRAMKYLNQRAVLPVIDSYNETKSKVSKLLSDTSYPWFTNSKN